MAIYFIDTINGADDASRDGLSESEAWKTYAYATAQTGSFAAGDTVKINGGSVLTEQVDIPRQEFTLTTYGQGMATIDAEYARDYAILCQDKGSTLVTIENISCINALQNCLLFSLSATSGSSQMNLTVNNCEFKNAGTGTTDVKKGTGFLVDATTYGLSNPYIELNNCIFADNAKHGFDGRGVCRGFIRKSEAYGNGHGATGHGFSTHPLTSGATGLTSGWSLLSGTVYYRETVSANDNVSHVVERTNHVRGLVPSTALPAAIPAWSWTQSGTTLYINIGEDPNQGGNTIDYTRRDYGALIFEECLSHDNIDFNGNEGHGFSFDDHSGNGKWIRCKSYNNAGWGFACWLGYSVEAELCNSYGNATGQVEDDVFFGRGSVNCKAINCTIDGKNITSNGLHIAETTLVEISNTISVNNAVRGFRAQNTQHSSTIGVNLAYNNTTDFDNFIGASNLNTNPLFIDADNGDYRCDTLSDCIGVGVKYWNNAPRPLSLSGEPLPDTEIDLGAFQSTHSINHPLNLLKYGSQVLNPATGQPAITGVETIEEILTANIGTIADADGLPAFPSGFSFQWLRGGVNISGATSQTYTLQAADVGNLISVNVSFTDNAGFPESLTSAETGAIAGAGNSFTENMTFDVGTLGVQVNEFTSAQGNTVYQNTQVLAGGQAAQCTIHQGKSAFSTWGGVKDFPVALVDGDNLYLTANLFFPSDWSMLTNFALKLFRLFRTGSMGENRGFMDLYINPDLTFKVQNEQPLSEKIDLNFANADVIGTFQVGEVCEEIDNSDIPTGNTVTIRAIRSDDGSLVINETGQVNANVLTRHFRLRGQTSGATCRMRAVKNPAYNANYDIPGVAVALNTWEKYIFHVRFSRSNPLIEVWRDVAGTMTLLYSDATDYTLQFADDICDQFNLFTYWNGGGNTNKRLWVTSSTGFVIGNTLTGSTSLTTGVITATGTGWIEVDTANGDQFIIGEPITEGGNSTTLNNMYPPKDQTMFIDEFLLSTTRPAELP